MAPIYQSQVWDHLGLVAAMYEELGLGAVMDHAMAQDATKRPVSLGQAVKAMVLHGLGFVHQQLYLVPRFFHHKRTARLMGPGLEAAHLHDAVLGRALEALYSAGVTPLYSLMAAQAAQRLGLTALCAHLDTTSCHVDGRYKSAAAPEAAVVPIPPGSSRDHRPALNQVRLARIVAQHAGIPLLLQPRRGNTHAQVECGRLITEHVQPLRTAPPLPSLVAERALDNVSSG
jgi:transposase